MPSKTDEEWRRTDISGLKAADSPSSSTERLQLDSVSSLLAG